MSAAIYLVRAGRTALSERGRLQGRTDRPLAAEGTADARRAGSLLVGADVVSVYSSPLKRAMETADIIARSVGCIVTPLEGLIDVDVGRWACRTVREIEAAEPRAFDAYFRFPTAASFPSGEQVSDAQRRAFAALGSIASQTVERAVVAVTHELPIRLISVRLKGLEGTAMWDPLIPTGSVTELRATNEGFEVPTVLEDLFRAASRRRSEHTSS